MDANGFKLLELSTSQSRCDTIEFFKGIKRPTAIVYKNSASDKLSQGVAFVVVKNGKVAIASLKFPKWELYRPSQAGKPFAYVSTTLDEFVRGLAKQETESGIEAIMGFVRNNLHSRRNSTFDSSMGVMLETGSFGPIVSAILKRLADETKAKRMP